MEISTERRQHTRFQTPSLSVTAKSLFGNSSDWVQGEISTVDFNRFGMGIELQYPLLAGDKLSLIIDGQGKELSEVTGVVCNRTKTDTGYRYGLQFDYDKEDKASDLAHEMLMMELHAVANVH